MSREFDLMEGRRESDDYHDAVKEGLEGMADRVASRRRVAESNSDITKSVSFRFKGAERHVPFDIEVRREGDTLTLVQWYSWGEGKTLGVLDNEGMDRLERLLRGREPG